MLEKIHAKLEHELPDESLNTVPKDGEKLVIAVPDDSRKETKSYDYTRGTPSDPEVLARRNKGNDVLIIYLSINATITL